MIKVNSGLYKRHVSVIITCDLVILVIFCIQTSIGFVYSRLSNISQHRALMIEALEEYSRSDNLVIYGVPETHSKTAVQSDDSTTTRPARDTSATSEQVFLNLCKCKLNLSIVSYPSIFACRGHLWQRDIVLWSFGCQSSYP